MPMASLIDRLLRRKPKEKHWYSLPVTGGSVSSRWGDNWWQRGYDPTSPGGVSTVEACVDAYAQTIASMPVGVYDENDDGSQARNRSVSAGRAMRSPNSYQTRSDLLLNLVKNLMYYGNAYAVAGRNDRNEIVNLHVMPAKGTQPYVEPDTKDVFYGLGDNPMAPDGLSVMVPARDVLHIRLFCPRHPLVGVSPIEAVVTSIAANGNITRSQAAFFDRMSRPSGIISTDMTLTVQQMRDLRAAWEEQAKGMDSGGVPILGSGMKFQPMSIASQDAQLIQAFNMTVTDIARAFRVPLPIVNLYENATYNNVEQLYGQWLSGGLGFLLEHIERALEKFFGLPANMSINFDTESLLRTDFEKKVEGYSQLVRSGVLSINEARVRINKLEGVENGNTPIVQQQMVPLGWTEEAPEPVVEMTEEQAASIGSRLMQKALEETAAHE